MVAVDKPAGQLVIPGRGAAEGECLKDQVARHVGAPVFVVHRIDQETSGVVLFAKHAAAHKALCLQFERRGVKKVYLARVLGRLEGEGVIDKPIREFGSGRMGVDRRGKASRTRWRSREPGDASSLIECEPLTGRRHQIRVHCYSIGHPILGDTRYGSPRPVGGADRLMLHAWKLSLARHDDDGTSGRVEIESRYLIT